ncbi:MAG: hypothetical protein RL215_679 [Planctomycetota bacterium]
MSALRGDAAGLKSGRLLFASVVANDFEVAVAVANVDVVIVGSAVGAALHATGSLVADETGGAEALVDVAESAGEVAEFADDGALQFDEADDHAEHEDGADEHEFCGQDNTGFVIDEILQHGSSSFLFLCL